MYAFDDKKGRPVCLVPEITGPLQEAWRGVWSKQSKSKRVFYITRCYRYESPQAGRYREFTQVGVELFGGSAPEDKREVTALMRSALDLCAIPYAVAENVKRGLAYYTEDGFEARCHLLGAQKQIAGGGRYAEGIGWAMGLERILMAQSRAATG